MMEKYNMIEIIHEWIKFYLRAETIYDIHSPFLFSIVKSIEQKSYRQDPHFLKIKALISELKSDTSQLPNVDYGAGSRNNNDQSKSISTIARTAASNLKSGILLYNLAAFLRPGNVLELGTNLGIGSAFLACGWQKCTITTIEGNPYLANKAKKNFTTLSIDNIEVITGQFKEVIPEITNHSAHFDLVFIDGHHNGEATIQYVEMLIPYLSKNAIIILDDIYWSADMKMAFHHLIASEHFSTYLDLFHKGILFLNPSLKNTKAMSYINYPLKPWRIGIWGGKF